MKIIRESLKFERGLEPKKAINVGKAKLDRDIIENTDWSIDLDKHGFLYEIIDLIKDYRGYPILILKNKQHDSWPYRGISRRGVFGEYQPTPEAALKDAKRVVNDDITLMRESINFERGLEPKQAMGIGLTALEKKIIETTDWFENLEGVLQVADIIKVIPDFRGFPIVIVKLHPENFAVNQEPYIGISTVDKTSFVETAEIAEHDAKIDIENWYFRKQHYH
jgi:hypothetical protein